LLALSAALGLGAVWAAADRLEDTFYVPLDHPAIRYYQEPADPVARLQKRLENGQAKLDFAPNRGYLNTLLRQLEISIDSQVLVFSKSSIQTAHISPRTLRAIYFNDDVAVGDVLELSALDPRLASFYTGLTRNHHRIRSNPKRVVRSGAHDSEGHMESNVARSIRTHCSGWPSGPQDQNE
jgi:hypothetical protein